jgi:hypothetical protein
MKLPIWRALVLGLALAGAALVPGEAGGEAPRLAGTGVAIAVTTDESGLLLDVVDGFRLIVVASDTLVRDPQGVPLTLGEIRYGDRVEYFADSWGGMSLARTVRVLWPVVAEAR